MAGGEQMIAMPSMPVTTAMTWSIVGRSRKMIHAIRTDQSGVG
jgi:hypothetical protein